MTTIFTFSLLSPQSLLVLLSPSKVLMFEGCLQSFSILVYYCIFFFPSLEPQYYYVEGSNMVHVGPPATAQRMLITLTYSLTILQLLKAWLPSFPVDSRWVRKSLLP
jgi:hypothetical protein